MATSNPRAIRYPWLRKVSLHFWAILETHIALARWQFRWQKTTSQEMRQKAWSDFVDTLIQVGQALDCGVPPARLSRFRAIGFWNRAKRLLTIVGSLTALPPEMRPVLSEAQSLRLIHFSELALDYMLISVDKALGNGWTEQSRRLDRRRKLKFRVQAHQFLARAYVELDVGDKATYLERARNHCDAAARLLEGEHDQSLSLTAATVAIGVGNTLLYYPTEDPVTYANQAVDVLSKARKLLEPLAVSAELASPAYLNPTKWSQLPRSERRRLAWRLATAQGRMMRSGIIEPSTARTKVLPILARVDRSLGIGFHRLGNLKEAIKHFDLALKDLPDIADVRAMILVDKGRAYLETTTGDKRQNLIGALECFQEVARAAKKIRLQRYVVLALMGYANAKLDLNLIGARDSRTSEVVFGELISTLRVAAGTARSMGWTLALQEGLFLLGRTYLLLGDNPRSYRAFALAARVKDRLQRRARTLRLKSYWVSSDVPLHDHLVDQALRYADSDLSKFEGRELKTQFVRHRIARRLAFALAEHGRMVLLREELSSRNLLPRGAAAEGVSELFRLRRSLHAAELRALHREWSPDAQMPGESDDLTVLRQRRAEAEDKYIKELEEIRSRFNDPDYDPDQPISSASYAEIRGMVTKLSKDQPTALVEYYVTDRSVVIFVLLPKRREDRIRLLNFTSRLSPGQLAELGSFWAEGLARKVHPAQLERGYLPQILDGLRDLVAYPAEAIASWEKENNQHIQRVIVIPHRFLHLLPIHAVPLPNGQPWGDAVAIQYAPSATILCRLLRARAPANHPQNSNAEGFIRGGAVCVSYSDPSDEVPLIFEAPEARAVVDATGAELLAGRDATPTRVLAALRRATYVHFVCHGVFDKGSPLETHLRLSPGEHSGRGQDQASTYGPLTLGEIFEGAHLPQTRLVVLSSCETGLTRVENRHEEYIGLPTGLLYAGAQAVISTLWAVSDLATWLLMRRFIKEFASGVGPTAALRSAQQALPRLSRESILREISDAACVEPDPYKSQRMVHEGENLFGEFPFAGPYWWAGFVVHGLC